MLSHHEGCPKCPSSDAFAIYVDDEGNHSGYCWSCKYTEPSKDYITRLKEEKSKGKKLKQSTKIAKDSSPVVTEEETLELKERTSLVRNGYRGIKDETIARFGVRSEFNEQTGKIQAVYYPCTQKGKLTGWKKRTEPKGFYKEAGRVGVSCDLFGQFLAEKASKKTVLLVGGEEDCLAAWQMLKKYHDSKNWEFDPAVVSPTVGESGAFSQIQGQYDFFNQFDKIIVGMDNDEAGIAATERIVEVLPRGKVYIAKWSRKDPNEMLLKDEAKKFLSCYYDAKKYVPSGIVESNSLSSLIKQELKTVKIPLPPFMKKLQKMMAGGIPLGRIVNLGSASGTGKSTFIDELIYFWIFHSPYRIGIVSLESTAGQYGIKLLSRHIQNKLELLDNEDALALIDTESVKAKEAELFSTSEGEPRFYLIEEAGGLVSELQGLVENLIISLNCKVIILDPLQDILAGLSVDEQENFMEWQKRMLRAHGITFLNVSHVRKSNQGQKANSTGAELHEEDFAGSSSIFKSGACNLLFTRNKEAENPIERNTTHMKASKIRWTGITGAAGDFYYDNETHTLHDFEEFFGKPFEKEE